ncbi:MAG: OmpP1/FadL family transporter [Bacteroidota bacterium]
MKKIILLVITLSCGTFVQAQDFIDNALLFSRVRPGGSARTQALGGAQVALGGDYSSALSNPAGLGMFNRSEFTFSTSLNMISAEANFFDTNTNDSKANFNVPGLSLVFHHESGKEVGFLGGSFAVSLSRINDLHQNYQYTGRNGDNSILDYFIADAGDIDPDELLATNSYVGSYYYSLTGLAYNNYLIEDRQDANGYFYDSQLNFTSATQTEISKRKGAQYQWSIAYGANFSDKFFVGANIGITTLRYKLSQVYQENELDYPDQNFQPARNFTIEEAYDIRGSGVNLGLGVTCRPLNFIQLGMSFVSPTYYQIADNYSARIDSQWNIYDVNDPSFPNQEFVFEEFDQPLVSDYSLTTPMRLTTGAAFISKLGFITADVEFVNYTKSKYGSKIAADFNNENSLIRVEYQPVVNYRIGAEYRYNIFRARAGYSFMADPFRRSDEVSRDIQIFSGGLGMRTKDYYIDLASMVSNTEGRRVPYTVSGPDPVANLKLSTLSFLVTVGFIF